ncbi:DUF799 domain-containing protein [Arcobacter sp. YIC-464]|uniref:DUF799 domain-containing protein n=1 Tax=Arcobacter sp. YIC-464 TaxID=3376631 RepID=UPI003C2A4521
MKNIFITLFSITIMIFLSGCAKNQELYDYSSFTKNKPKSILVVLPTNESLDIKGSSATLANSILPLSEAGYYVFPPALVNETFKHNGVYEAKEIRNVSLEKLKEIFGADSVLYINVKKYGNNYAVLSSKTEIELEAKLVDLHSGKILWNKETKFIKSSGDSGGGLIGMLVTAVVAQIVNESTDQAYEASMIANNILFRTNCNDCILYGSYSPNFNKDLQLK